jgi:hypothetical protein
MNWRRFRRIALSLVIALALFALSACSVLKLVGEEDSEPALKNVEEGILTCSDECRDRGQCGLDVQGNDIVLLNTTTPDVGQHDKGASSGTDVTIVKKEIQSVIQVSDNKTLDIPFYEIILPSGDQAWVAGWCLEN